jgi:hypothetical protein
MQPAYAPGPRRAQGRATDRRRGAGELLRTVTSGLNATREVARVRERFEEELRALVRARSIGVYDGALAAPADPGVLVIDIPAEVPPQRPRIEAVFDPGRSLDGWTCQVLESAAQVAALLLEIERAQGRAPLFARVRGDGAAPLIGSSLGIRLVRERIERVAATDFTVLIEGASGPQPHCSFVEVFCEAPVSVGEGEVEGARQIETALKCFRRSSKMR